jgi:predicted dehydrogenase
MRIVQVGIGGWGWSWTAVVRETVGIELAAVADASSDALARARDELRLPAEACFPSLAAALEDVEADAVLVATPPATHASLAIEALQAGKHVLVEKPLAASLEEAASMLRAADEAGRRLMVAQNYRFRPPARAAQAAVAGGALGDLVAVRLCFRRDTRQLFPPGDFRYAMRHPLLLDMSIHHLDLLRMVSGRDVATVYARSWPVPDSPYRSHPAVAATFILDGGAVATYDGNWAAFEADTSWNADWEVIGSEGRLLWRGGVADALTGDLALQPWGRTPEPVPPTPLPTTDRAGVLAAFRDAIANGTRPETDGTDNVRSLAAVLAAVRSAETGEVVDVAALLDAALG